MGLIFDIKRFAVHDGPGIRTTVFLKGCPLACQWCHNPESMNPTACTVSKTVQFGTHTIIEDEIVGREMSVSETLKEILKERVFMQESGGGVTFSGGEPLLQAEFLNELLQACKKQEMHTAVDTSGFCKWENLEKIAQHTDLFLYDLKIMDVVLHRKYTGVSNELILNNLIKLFAIGKRVIIRLPMIPDISFTELNVNQSIDFLLPYINNIEEVNLLPYHNTASHKYERFGMLNNLPAIKSVLKSELEDAKKQFEKAGFKLKIGG